MAYTTNQALETLNRYLGITDDEKQIIENTKRRGFVFSLPNGEKELGGNPNDYNKIKIPDNMFI